MSQHRYVERRTGRVLTERLLADEGIKFLYSKVREHAPALFNCLTGRAASSLLGHLYFDRFLGMGVNGDKLARKMGIDLLECVELPGWHNTPRRMFERKIRYWETRPMPAGGGIVASPADSYAVVGSLSSDAAVFAKEKFFSFEELLGPEKTRWLEAFSKGEYAIFRLTPEKYHYNHSPVSGVVADVYELDGAYHSCNPSAVVEMVTPYSKNRRVVTIVDTDVTGGTRIGLVAVIEIVALMIGRIEQRYSPRFYDSPTPAEPGLFMTKGQPKSLFRPGSSTDVLLFQKDRMDFSRDLSINSKHGLAENRFSNGFGVTIVETEVAARSAIGYAMGRR